MMLVRGDGVWYWNLRVVLFAFVGPVARASLDKRRYPASM